MKPVKNMDSEQTTLAVKPPKGGWRHFFRSSALATAKAHSFCRLISSVYRIEFVALQRIVRKDWILKLLITVFIFSASQMRGADDAVEAFKTYLSHPPCISKIIYSEVSCKDTVSRTLAGGWCGSSFFVRELTGSENLDLPISLTNRNHSVLYVGRLGDTRWQIAGYNLSLSIQPDLSKPDPYAGMSDGMKTMLDGVINLGSQHVQPGACVWSGDNFTVKASSWSRQFGATEFHGKIIVSGGLVSRMIINGSGTWDYRYSATANLPLGMPTEIICGGNDSCISKIFIKEMIPAMTADEMKIFDPKERIDKTVTLLKVLSNSIIIIKPLAKGPLVTQLAKEDLASAGTVNNISPVKSQKPIVRLAILLIILLSSIGFAILAIRNRKS